MTDERTAWLLETPVLLITLLFLRDNHLHRVEGLSFDLVVERLNKDAIIEMHLRPEIMSGLMK